MPLGLTCYWAKCGGSAASKTSLPARIVGQVEQGLTSPPRHYIGYTGDGFFRGHKTQPRVSKYWRHT